MEQRGTTDGYGRHIHPMKTTQIWSKSGGIIPYTLKSSSTLDIDFSTDQKPMILAYQILPFWSAAWNATKPQVNITSNVITHLKEICYAMEFIRGTINIELFSITRQRLLQQGSTNVQTYDFETSQNLIIATYNRTPNTIQWKAVADLDPTKLRHNEEVFKNEMTAQIEELPQRHSWIKTFKFPITEKLYEIPNFKKEKKLIPGPTNIYKKGYGINDNHEIYKDEQEIENINTFCEQIRNIQSWTMICLAQPLVPDETGFMKFRYQIRLTTELEGLYHIKPDMLESNRDQCIYNREIMKLPTMNDISPAAPNHEYLCMPHNLEK